MSRPLRLWTVNESFDGPLTARLLTPDERMAYGRGELRVHAVIVAAEQADAETLARRLHSARLLLRDWPGPAYRNGYRDALLELKAFIRQESERLDPLDEDFEDRGCMSARLSALERVNTWAQAFLPTEPAPSPAVHEEPLG